jgi:hypothetical protein
LIIILAVLRFTASDFPFNVFKSFLSIFYAKLQNYVLFNIVISKCSVYCFVDDCLWFLDLRLLITPLCSIKHFLTYISDCTHPIKNRGWTQVLRRGKQFLLR